MHEDMQATREHMYKLHSLAGSAQCLPHDSLVANPGAHVGLYRNAESPMIHIVRPVVLKYGLRIACTTEFANSRRAHLYQCNWTRQLKATPGRQPLQDWYAGSSGQNKDDTV